MDAKLAMFLPVGVEPWIVDRLHQLLFCDEMFKPVVAGLIESSIHFAFVGKGFPPNDKKLIKQIKVCLMLAVNQRVSCPEKLLINLHELTIIFKKSR